MESRQTLHPQAIVALRELIRANVDSGQSFGAAAGAVASASMAELFQEIGHERDANAAALEEVAIADGASGPQGDAIAASAKGAVHRWWTRVHAATKPASVHAILCEAERSEHAIKDAYDRILVKIAGSPLSELLTRQHREVKQHHDQIRDLRERTAAASGL